MSEPVVRREESRFVISVDGEDVGELTFVETPDAITLDHTGVDPAHRGGSIADRLVRTGLDELSTSTTKRIISACPYVARWIEKHPDYAPLTER